MGLNIFAHFIVVPAGLSIYTATFAISGCATGRRYCGHICVEDLH